MVRSSDHYDLVTDSLYHDGRYKAMGRLGVGSTSTVWAVTDLREDRIVAIKVLDDDYRNAPEEKILRLLAYYNPSHPGFNYVMKLLDSFTIAEDTKTHVCLVVEMVGPSFAQKLSPNGVLEIGDAKPYFHQLLLGLQYAHAAGVIHTDIKLDNILVSLITGDICLCDWGEAESSKIVSLRPEVQPQDLRAPEVILSVKPWTSAIDIWNFGALILEVVENKHMFNARDTSDNYAPQEHLQQMVNFFGPLPQSWLEPGHKEIVCHSNQGDVLRDLLVEQPSVEGAALIEFWMDVMVIDPEERPTATQLIDHVWFKKD